MFQYPFQRAARDLNAVLRYKTGQYGMVLGVVFDMDNQKNNSRSMEGDGTSEKSDQSLGSKTLITVF